jgi:hypothetical protein
MTAENRENSWRGIVWNNGTDTLVCGIMKKIPTVHVCRVHLRQRMEYVWPCGLTIGHAKVIKNVINISTLRQMKTNGEMSSLNPPKKKNAIAQDP